MHLHLRVKHQAAIIAEYENQINELKRYLNLPKFKGVCNDYVNVNDIFLRLQEMQREIDRLSDE